MIKIDEYDHAPIYRLPDVEIIEAPPSGASLFSLDEVKVHLRLETDEDDEDSLLKRITGAATEYVESICSRSILPRKVAVRLRGWPNGSEIDPPLNPIRAITAIKYLAVADGSVQTIDPANYRIRRSRRADTIAPVYGYAWPAYRNDLDPIILELDVGYEPDISGSEPNYSANVPSQLQEAVLLAIGDLYENRESQAVSTRIYASIFENRTFRRLISDFRTRRF